MRYLARNMSFLHWSVSGQWNSTEGGLTRCLELSTVIPCKTEYEGLLKGGGGQCNMTFGFIFNTYSMAIYVILHF